MFLKAKPALGQVWVWTCVDNTTQMFLITQIKGDTCKGIILYDEFGAPAGTVIKEDISQFYKLDCFWTCLS